MRTVIVLVALFGVGAAQTAPKVGGVDTYKDWSVGCDNTLSCTAVSLAPEQQPDDLASTVVIWREAGAAGDISLSFPDGDRAPKAPRDFMVDGRQVASAPVQNGAATVKNGLAQLLAVAMASGKSMEIKTADKVIGRVSLAGVSAALRRMDEQQGRQGTTTALVATGPRGADAVKPAPPMPTFTRAPFDPSLTVEPLSDLERTTAFKLGGCDPEDLHPGDDVEIHALSRTTAVVLATCGSGPYNSNSSVLLATGQAGQRTFVRAKFDYEPGWGTAGSEASLVNGGWDGKTGALYNQAKGRALADCGHSQTFVWDGAKFRMTEMQVMNECRGSYEWITVWRAKPTP